MDNLYGEMFANLRDALMAEGFSESQAIRLTRRSLGEMPRLEAGYSPAISSRALQWEVSRRAERLIRPLIEKAEKEYDDESHLLSFRDCVDYCEKCLEDVRAGIGLLMRDILGLDPSPIVALRNILIVTGAEGLTEHPPILLQERRGAPVLLHYGPAIAQHLIDETLFEMAELARFAEEKGLDYFVAKEKRGEKLTPQERFASTWLSPLAKELLPPLLSLAWLQWKAAGIVGTYMGVDYIEMGWYGYAVEHMKRAWEFCRDALLSGGKTHGLFDLCKEEVEPTQVLDLVGAVTRYIRHGEPLEVPALVTVTGQSGDKITSTRLVINHPLVSAKEVQQKAREARKALGSRAHPLSDGDETFLALIREAGGEPGQRLPKGFWQRFCAIWSERYPDNPMTVNHLRVKYHRLVKRIRPAS